MKILSWDEVEIPLGESKYKVWTHYLIKPRHLKSLSDTEAENLHKNINLALKRMRSGFAKNPHLKQERTMLREFRQQLMTFLLIYMTALCTYLIAFT